MSYHLLLLLLNMNTNNITRISWNGICSDNSVAKNGVKQGGVISRDQLNSRFHGRDIFREIDLLP